MQVHPHYDCAHSWSASPVLIQCNVNRPSGEQHFALICSVFMVRVRNYGWGPVSGLDIVVMVHGKISRCPCGFGSYVCVHL